MKRTIQKNTLSFSTSKKMMCIRTPEGIWEQLKREFNFTVDVCSSDKNYLVPKHYTEKEDGLKQDWTGEIVYCHPMFDIYIGKWVEKAFNSKCTTIMLIPASTHTRYFHKYIYHNPNCEIRFLEKPNKGWDFKMENGTSNPSKIGYIKPLMVVIFRNDK